MSIPEHRLSTELIDAPFLSPDGALRVGYITDWEKGPKAVEDTSGGMFFQDWEAKYDGNSITLFPQSEGSPVELVSGLANIKQISFCFDQNAQPCASWVHEEVAYLRWYDSAVQEYIVTPFPDVISAHLSLDDKRSSQVTTNDIIFWITRQSSEDPPVYDLYHLEQRDRFTEEYPTMENCPPFLASAGMHRGYRHKIQLSYRNP